MLHSTAPIRTLTGRKHQTGSNAVRGRHHERKAAMSWVIRRQAKTQGCGEPIESQGSRLSGAIGATTEYELKGSQLLLRGDDEHIVLEVDNP